MISMVHDPVRDEIGEDGYPPIPAGGRHMEMDWDRVAAAFQSAVEHVGWDADLEIHPAKQYVIVWVPRDEFTLDIDITGAFYGVVEDALGVEQFMSIWIDFLPQD